MNYSGKSAKTVQNSNFDSSSRRNRNNHKLYLLQSNMNINLYNYWIYFNRAGVHLHGQSKFTHFHIFVSLLIMDIINCIVHNL